MKHEIAAAGDGDFRMFAVGELVFVGLYYQLEDGDPSADWQLYEPESYHGTVVGGPALDGLLYSDLPKDGVNVMPDCVLPKPAANIGADAAGDPYANRHPRYVVPREWYQRLGERKLLLRRTVEVIDPSA